MLTGQELLDFVKANGDLTQTELAREAGYTRISEKNGKTYVLVKAFNDAVITATGINIKIGKAPGKLATYETTVHRSGIALVGKTYVEQYGLKPGDRLTIELTDDAIRLVPMAPETDEAGAPATPAVHLPVVA